MMRRKRAGALLAGTAFLCIAGGIYGKALSLQKPDEIKVSKTEHTLVGISEFYETYTEKEILDEDSILEGINSQNAVLIEAENGTVLAERNMEKTIYPASMTKIMTAVITLENIVNLDEYTVLTENDFTNLYIQDASMAGFQPGEEVTYRDLLYGMLLPSGAECCLAAANRISGSEEAFTALMNQKAQELGMEHTHFENSTGLENSEHVSTVGDIAKLMQYAVSNGQFYEILKSPFYYVSPTNLHPEGFTFYSTVAGNVSSMEVNGGNLLGGKTGYTEEAGLCLASLALIHEKYYILVTAKAEGTPGFEAAHLIDSLTVYNRIESEIV